MDAAEARGNQEAGYQGAETWLKTSEHEPDPATIFPQVNQHSPHHKLDEKTDDRPDLLW